MKRKRAEFLERVFEMMDKKRTPKRRQPFRSSGRDKKITTPHDGHKGSYFLDTLKNLLFLFGLSGRLAMILEILTN